MYEIIDDDGVIFSGSEDEMIKALLFHSVYNIEYDEQDVYKLALVITFAKKQLKKLNS